jgi:AraC-like DNA-binding protein
VGNLYRADDRPASVRVDYWHHVVEDTLTPLDLALPSDTLDGRDQMRVGDLGPVRVVELSTGESSRAVRRRRHISSSDPELLKIDVQLRGRGVIEQSGREQRYIPGDFTLVDLSRPCAWSNGPSAGLVAVTFPRHLLPLHRDDLGRLTGVRMPGDRGAGALVSALVRQLPRHLDDIGSAEGGRLGATLLDLLAVVLLSRVGRRRDVPAESRRRALLASVYAYTEENLADPALSPRSIAAAHYVSVRYLHQLFEGQQTTAAGWIRRRRLERCRRDLLNPALRELPVSAIAAQWGFTSAAHFSRLFRTTYGLPPVDFRRIGTVNDPVSPNHS